MANPRPMPGAKQTGGRPRAARHRATAFSTWLEAGDRSVADVAKALGVSTTAVYHLRDSRFKPGLELAVKIADLSGGAVPVQAWAPGYKPPSSTPAAGAEPTSDEALTMAYLLMSYIAAPSRRRPNKILKTDQDAAAARWAVSIDELVRRHGARWRDVQDAIKFSQANKASRWRTRITSGAALLRWWPSLLAELGASAA